MRAAAVVHKARHRPELSLRARMQVPAGRVVGLGDDALGKRVVAVLQVGERGGGERLSHDRAINDIREAGRATDARIEKLVRAIGELIKAKT